jgi:hypothetical protein
LVALVALVLAVSIGSGASAKARSFPVPRCSWVSSSKIQSTFGVNVRAGKGVWVTRIAPVLTCPYFERSPKLQLGNLPIALVQYRELQRFTTKGFTPVKGLGSCVERSSCPQPHRPAWIKVIKSRTDPAPYGIPYVAGVELRVEDGLNAIVIVVANPDGPLPVRDEIAQAKKLARALLSRFHW